MRIGIVTPWDVDDPKAWSGMIQPMFNALRAVADVEVLSTREVTDSVVDRGLTRLLNGKFGMGYLPGHALSTSMKRGRHLHRRLAKGNVDVIIAIAASQDIAFLPQGTPVVQAVDATFNSIHNFYPLFSNLNPLSSWQARIQSRRSADRTLHMLAASHWAQESLLREGFPREEVTVALFGPAITPTSPLQLRHASAPLQLLMVSSNWERKAGPDVLAVLEELDRRGTEVELTVVGDAPHLPPHIKTPGRLSRDELAGFYSASDVLLELSHSNAAGVTVTDAAAFGLPVVAADTGGMSSLVIHGSSGLLVEPGNIEAASSAVEQMADVNSRQAYRSAALARSGTVLNWESWAKWALAACSQALGAELKMRTPPSATERLG